MFRNILALVLLSIQGITTAQPVDKILEAKTGAELTEIIQNWVRRPSMSVDIVEFDNTAILSPGLTFAMARAGTAYDEAGQAQSSNVARYANSHRVAAIPAEPVTLTDFVASSFRPLHSGLAADGSTPILTVRKGTTELHVHARTDPEAYYNDSETTGSYITTLGTNGDLLNGQTSSSGGTAEIANHEFVPGSAAVWKGYVVVGCDHLFDDGDGFDSVGCALAYTTITRLEAGTNPWILLGVTEPVNIGPDAHHQAWSLTKFEVSDTLCVFYWTDYGTGIRAGGNCQRSTLDISSGSPVWTHVRLFDEYRADLAVGITSNSAANPTVITTSSAHGLSSGDKVAIRGQSGTVNIDGNYSGNQVVVTGASTLTIAVDCTAGGGTGGTLYSDDDEHSHSAGLIIDSDGDWHEFETRGDGFERNRLLHRRLAAADVAAKNWGAGTTYTHGTYGATGISGSFVIEDPHANLGSATAVWGDVATTAGRAYRHNQVINLVQADAACTTLLCGTDETAPAILSMTWNDTLGCPEWHAPYIPNMSSANGDGAINFIITGNPGGPFIAKTGADGWDDSGTGGSGEADLEAVVLYSPDGDSWTQIIDHQQAAQFAAVLHAGKVYLGCAASGTAQYITLPTTTTRQPLQIANNVASSMTSINATTFTGESTGVSITDLASDLSDLPAAFNGEGPPCHRNNMMLWNVTGDLSAARNHYGQGTIATGLPDSFTDIHVRAWVRAVNYDGSTYDNRATVSLWSRFMKTTTPNEASPGGTTLFDADKWTPIDLWFNNSQLSGTISGSWSLRWQLRAVGLTTQTAPAQFVIAVEGVYLDTGKIRSNGSAAALTEIATVSGITKRTAWSAYGEIEVPWDQWDNRTGGGPPGNAKEAGSSITSGNKPRLFWFDDSVGADLIAVYARPDTYEIELDVNGTTTVSSGNDKYWRRGNILQFLITCNGTNATTLYYLATDGTINSVTVADVMQFDQIISDDPMLWHRFIVKEGVDAEPETTLRNAASGSSWRNTTTANAIVEGLLRLRRKKITTTQQ